MTGKITPDATRAPGVDSLLKPFRLFEDAEDVQLATLGDLSIAEEALSS